MIKENEKSVRIHTGLGLASQLGYPTINVSIDGFEYGIYSCTTQYGPGILYITGTREGECHILDNNVNVESNELKISNINKLRLVKSGGLLDVIQCGLWWKKNRLLVCFGLCFVLVVFVLVCDKQGR